MKTFGSIAGALLLSTSLACSRSDGPADVTVIVEDGSGPVVAAVVLLHDPDGTPGALLETDSNGRVSAELPRGGMVTVGIDYGATFILTTWTEIRDGDTLVVGSTRNPPTPTIEGSANVTLPGPAAGAASYVAGIGCSFLQVTDATVPVPVDVYSDCDPDFYDAVGYALDGQNAITDVASAADIPRGQDTTFSAWEAPLVLDFALQNPPVGAADFFFLSTIAQRDQDFFITLDGGPLSGATAFVPQAIAPGFGQGLRTFVSLNHAVTGAGSPYNSRFSEVSVPPGSGAIPIDLTDDFMPPLTGLSQVDTPEGRPTLEAENAAEASGVATRARIAYSTAAGSADWTMIGPGDRTTFAFPPLDATLADVDAPQFPPIFQVEIVDLGVVAGDYQGYKDALAGQAQGLPIVFERIAGIGP